MAKKMKPKTAPVKKINPILLLSGCTMGLVFGLIMNNFGLGLAIGFGLGMAMGLSSGETMQIPFDRWLVLIILGVIVLIIGLIAFAVLYA